MWHSILVVQAIDDDVETVRVRRHTMLGEHLGRKPPGSHLRCVCSQSRRSLELQAERGIWAAGERCWDADVWDVRVQDCEVLSGGIVDSIGL